MEDKSVATYFYLLSGELLKGAQPANWRSPQGTMINGDLMFEEAFLSQIYWLVKKKVIALVEKDQKIIVRGLGFKDDLPPFSQFLVNHLPKEETTLRHWVRQLALASGHLNPARDLFKKVEAEAEEFRRSVKSRFLIFTFTSQEWDQAKLKELSARKLAELQQLWQEGEKQSWWETARRELKVGLTSARFEHERQDERKFE